MYGTYPFCGTAVANCCKTETYILTMVFVSVYIYLFGMFVCTRDQRIIHYTVYAMAREPSHAPCEWHALGQGEGYYHNISQQRLIVR